MRVFPASVPDVVLVEPEIHRDARGFFYESHNERAFTQHVADVRFVQDNCSRSEKHVLRGLHYQVSEPQGKLVSVLSGEVFDAAVDLRRGSRTFGQCTANILSAQSRQCIWIPPGFAHGFLVLSDVAEVHYKTTAYWAPRHERCIVWNDPDLAIAWPLSIEPILSDRDRAGVSFRDADVYR